MKSKPYDADLDRFVQCHRWVIATHSSYGGMGKCADDDVDGPLRVPRELMRQSQQPRRTAERVGGERQPRQRIFWPALLRSWQPWTTRCAMPASAVLPYARGSYIFLLPTSPSIFSTPP